MGEKKSIESMMTEDRIFEAPREFVSKAHIKSREKYEEMYERSIRDPEGFWAEMANDLEWFEKWDKVMDYNFEEPRIEWFKGGKLNVTYNCLDRHVKTWRKNKAALIWEGNEPGGPRTLTYQQLYREVNRFSNLLRKYGVEKGDRVCIYMPMIPELAIAMLACARIGAIHSIVFGGFSADSLRDRIVDSEAKVLITADGTYRGKKTVPVKATADKALEQTPTIKKVIVVKHADADIPMKEMRDLWWHQEMEAEDIDNYCPPEEMDAEDPLFILYTSGSTGKPKGVLHTQAGYLIYTLTTFKYIFDYHEKDTYWCTADIGWITGHSYIVYGPLAAGATSFMFGGIPTYPAPDRFWDIVERYGINQFYTAPTAIRALMRLGDSWVEKHDLSSLRLLGSVGEPINPEAWNWYYKVVGKERCPIVDTWWQTETGGIMISPLPGAIPLKPGSATVPFFGVEPAILREDGSECDVNEGGYLVIKRAWPGMMRTVYGDPKRFKYTYFSQYPGNYMAGDGAKRDEDGYYWIMGRIDDVINVSGHRLGTAEIESALVANENVAEAAVVGFPHDVKGQGIYAFVILKQGKEGTDELSSELVNHVRGEIGPIAKIDKLQFVDGLPKTRSGKIMRRILKKIGAGKTDELGDTSTLANEEVVERLVANRL